MLANILYVILGAGTGMFVVKITDNEKYQNRKAWYKTLFAFVLSFWVAFCFPVCATACYTFFSSFYLGDGVVMQIVLSLIIILSKIASVPISIVVYYIACNKTSASGKSGFVLYAIYCVFLILTIYFCFVTGAIFEGIVWIISLAISLVVLLSQYKDFCYEIIPEE